MYKISMKWLLAIILIIFLALFYFLSVPQEKMVDVDLKLSPEDVGYDAYKEQGSFLVDNLLIIDKNFQHAIKNVTNQNWSTIIYEPYDNEKTKLASILFLISQESLSGLEYTYVYSNGRGLKNVTDEEWVKLNITRLNDSSKEDILKLIENLKTIEKLYLGKELKSAQVDIKIGRAHV
jgi:hypothetical protein